MLLRRDVLTTLAGAVLAACAPPASRPVAAVAPAPSPPPPPARKKILVLGGTGFAGPPIVTTALERGHTVTLFNRGKSAPGMFPEVETILGDRITQLDRLAGRSWDAVVDTWAPGPTLVSRAAQLLRERVAHYVYLSTISVYKLGREPLDESSPVLELPPGLALQDIKKIDETVYGPLKALAEKAAEAGMPGRSTSIRSGLIAGPGDPTDRWLYWPMRLMRGGDMIAPGSPGDRMQFIDVRDLGAWVVTLIERGVHGTFNATGPANPSFGATLEDCRAALGSSARLEWIDSAWLEAHGASGWEAFPVAVGSADEQSGFAKVSAARAIAQGLAFRPPGATARDALAWYAAQPEERRRAPRPGLSPEREAELLRAWHERARSGG